MMNQGCQKCGTLARSRLNLFSYIDFTNTTSELLIYGEGKWQCEEWDVWISLHFYHLGVKCSIACTQYDFGNPFIAKVIRSNRLYMKFEIPVQPTQSEIKSTSKTIQLFTSIQYHMRWKISRIFYSFICNNVSVLGAKMRKVSFEIVYILVIQFNICVRNEFFHIHVYFYLFRFTIFASPSSFFLVVCVSFYHAHTHKFLLNEFCVHVCFCVITCRPVYFNSFAIKIILDISTAFESRGRLQLKTVFQSIYKFTIGVKWRVLKICWKSGKMRAPLSLSLATFLALWPLSLGLENHFQCFQLNSLLDSNISFCEIIWSWLTVGKIQEKKIVKTEWKHVCGK